MEYGANILLSMDARSIRKMVESDNETAVNDFLDNNESEDEFWEKVYDNLKAEKIRLLIVADEIPNRLQNIIEFLNRNMESVTILAVEIKQYTKDDTRTLVSRVIGQSIEAQSKKTERIGAGPVLDKDTFFENLDQYGKEFFQKLFKITKKQGLKIKCGTKGFSANVTLREENEPFKEKNVSLFQGFSQLAANGQYIGYTGDIKNKVKNGDELFKEYINEITKVDGFNRNSEGFMFKIDKNLDDENWKQLENTIFNITEQIRKNGLME